MAAVCNIDDSWLVSAPIRETLLSSREDHKDSSRDLLLRHYLLDRPLARPQKRRMVGSLSTSATTLEVVMTQILSSLQQQSLCS